ncbi:unnamed protein product [Discosporangium mesarthrocarpum]
MPLPELYPLGGVPYDEEEDVGARAMNAAMAAAECANQVLLAEMREAREAATVEELTDALMAREADMRLTSIRRFNVILPSCRKVIYACPKEKLYALLHTPHPLRRGKQNAHHLSHTTSHTPPLPNPLSPCPLLFRRDALVDPIGLATTFPQPEPRLSPLKGKGSHGEDDPGLASVSGFTPHQTTVPPLKENPVNQKLEGTASRDRRERILAKKGEGISAQPPPGDYPLGRRRGALGEIPGAAILSHVPAVWDWELEMANEARGLLRRFEGRFGGQTCHQDSINSVAYSPDERRVASASSDGTIKLWDTAQGKQVRVLSEHHEGSPVWDVSWSADSIFLVSCGADRSVVVWNTAAATPFVRRFLGHTDQVRRCLFADSLGHTVLSCGDDGTVRQWQITPDMPAPPPRPFITYKARTWVMLNWRPAAGCNEEITAYVISWRLGRKGKYEDELTVPGDQLRRDVTDLLPGSLYFFRVAGVNQMGQGAWSEETPMVDTDMDVPLPIGRPLAEAAGPTWLTLSFFAPRPTLPKMKIHHFIMQRCGSGCWCQKLEGFLTSEGIRGLAGRFVFLIFSVSSYSIGCWHRYLAGVPSSNKTRGRCSQKEGGIHLMVKIPMKLGKSCSVRHWNFDSQAQF